MSIYMLHLFRWFSKLKTSYLLIEQYFSNYNFCGSFLYRFKIVSSNKPQWRRPSRRLQARAPVLNFHRMSAALDTLDLFCTRLYSSKGQKGFDKDVTYAIDHNVRRHYIDAVF